MSHRHPLLLAFALGFAAVVAAGCGDGSVVGINQPPVVMVQSPQPGQAVSPVGFIVQATATDDQGVRRVEISLEGELVAVLESAPYETYVTTLGLAPGTRSLRVRALDDENLSREAIVSVSVPAKSYRQLTNSEAGMRHTEPAWHPLAVQIAYSRQGVAPSATKNIYLISAAATEGTGQRLTDALQQDGNAVYSPDGAWIAFESNRTGFHQIYAARLASGEAMPLTNIGGANQRRPTWTRTAGVESWIAYDTDRSPASATRRDLYMVRVAVDGDSITIVEPTSQPDLPADTNPSDDTAPQWTSDAFLVVNSDRSSGNHAVTVLDPFLSQDAQVVNGTNQFLIETYAPALSPRDAYVAFTEGITGTEKVFVVPASGPGDVRYEIAPGSGVFPDGSGFPDAMDPAWSPTGTKIAFVSTRTGTEEIWILE